VSAPTVLVTRTEPKASAFAARLRLGGWSPLVWPAMTVEHLPAPPTTTGHQAVLFTSAHAARALPANSLSARPPVCLCVGEATALAARAAGYAGVGAAGGDAARLAEAVLARLSPADGRLLFARGETVAGDIAGTLREAGFTVDECVVYRAIPNTAPTATIAAMLDTGRVGAVTLHSPRGARVLAEMGARLGWRLDRTTAVCVSEAAAEACRSLDWAGVAVAAEPTDDAMIRALDVTRPASGA
jgi:uroporphyrinogen-III synthase